MEIIAAILIIICVVLCLFGFGMFLGTRTRNEKTEKIYYTIGVMGGIGMLVGYVYITIT